MARSTSISVPLQAWLLLLLAAVSIYRAQNANASETKSTIHYGQRSLSAGAAPLSSVSSLAPPVDWARAVAEANMLFDAGSVLNTAPELRPSIGNGYMATVVSSDTIYVSGLFNGHLSQTPSHRARIPSPLNVSIATTDDVYFVGSRDQKHLQKQRERKEDVTLQLVAEPVGVALDMRHGEVIERYSIVQSTVSAASRQADTTNTTVIATVDVRFFAHRVYRSLAAVEVTIRRVTSGGMSASSKRKLSEDNNADPEPTISVLLTQNQGAPSVDITFSEVSPSRVPDGAVGSVGEIMVPETSSSDKVKIAVVTSAIASDGAQLVLNGSETEKAWTFLTAVHTSIDSDGTDPLEAAISSFEVGQELVAAGLFECSHARAWAEDVWRMRSLEVGTTTAESLALAQVVNASFYYILSSMREDYPWGLSPGGLASNGYNGHTFWDQESWMYPPVLAFNQAGARSLLEYRFNHISGAFVKAHNSTFYPPSGYQGTMFPWESAFTGQEACPVTASTGRYEQHITGDIAIAIQQLYYASGDKKWARARALPLMEGIATFWASRATPGRAVGSWVVNGVTPPDEYAVNVNNSAYTNAVAALSLEFAVELAQSLGGSAPAAWLSIASGLRSTIPFDTALGVTLEFDSYHGQTIKQADVALLTFPLDFIKNETVAENNLAYYSAKTDSNGPAMTWGVYSAGYLAFGNSNLAAKYFARAHANSKPPFYVWTETPTGGTTNFITGAGGFLGAISYGYGGLLFKRDALELLPQIPPGAEELRLRGIEYRGSVLDIHRVKEKREFSITLLSRDSSDAESLVVETTKGEHRQELNVPGRTAFLPVNTLCRVKFYH